jgi:hypothetical protein
VARDADIPVGSLTAAPEASPLQDVASTGAPSSGGTSPYRVALFGLIGFLALFVPLLVWRVVALEPLLGLPSARVVARAAVPYGAAILCLVALALLVGFPSL